MAEQWQMKACYTHQTATVKKFLEGGFEPFWGYRTTLEQKPTVKMYFRKAPTLEILQEVKETDAIKIDPAPLDEFSNQLRSILSGVLDIFTERFFERLAKSQAPFHIPEEYELLSDPDLGLVARKKNKEPLKKVADRDDKSMDEGIQSESDSIEDNPLGEREAPVGDTFRPLADDEPLPQVQSGSARTPQQDSVIESLRKKNDNISIMPTQNGIVRVLVGAIEYTIQPSGSWNTKDTGARTSSL